MRRENVLKGVDHKYPSACGECRLNSLTMENLEMVLIGGVLLGILLTGLFIIFLFHRAYKQPICFSGLILASDRLVEKKSKLVSEGGAFSKDDYEFDKYDANLLVSRLDNRLRVRITNHKNPDIRTFATSLPHRFTAEQANKTKEEILEIMQCGVSEYELTIHKSPAADFSDFTHLIFKEIFQQLHRVYIKECSGEDKNKILTSGFVRKDMPPFS